MALALAAAAPAHAPLQLAEAGAVEGRPPSSNSVSAPGPTKGIKAIIADRGGRRTGTVRNDNLLGGRGSDRLDGAAGDDVIRGDRHRREGGRRATDTLIGGSGRDTIYGGRGYNRIYGGRGGDYLQGGAFRNVIRGEAGDDEIRIRGNGRTRVFGGAGNDIVHALTTGRGYIDCGSGSDTIFASNKRLTLRGCEKVVKRYGRRRERPAVPRADPPPSGLGQPSCEADAVTATTASAVRSAVAAGSNVCVTANVGDLKLDRLPSSTVRYVGTSVAGSIGHVEISDSSHLTFRARVRSFVISSSNHITIEQSVIGGTRENRILDQLIFVPNKSDDLTIRDNDIGWTTADNTGNTGYGIRAYRDHDRLRIERNYIHHIGGDGIQLAIDGDDGLVDRNEIAYVAPPPTSDEHSDDIQIVGGSPNLRITNNYLHHNGWLDARGPHSGGSGPYIHAGDSHPMLVENNLIIDERNFMQIGGLGTGGTTRSNLTFRRNTIARTGTMWSGATDLEWDLSDGSKNVLERNAIGRLAVTDGTPTHTLVRDNVLGSGVVLDAAGNCTSAACNPVGEEPIGYRKPSGVHW